MLASASSIQHPAPTTTYYLLPITYCLLPITYYLLLLCTEYMGHTFQLPEHGNVLPTINIMERSMSTCARVCGCAYFACVLVCVCANCKLPTYLVSTEYFTFYFSMWLAVCSRDPSMIKEFKCQDMGLQSDAFRQRKPPRNVINNGKMGPSDW
jgi:hypothetical protein